MLPLLEFRPEYPVEHSVDTGQEIPKELDIFFMSEKDFLPPGKTFKDLTPEEMERLRSQYRFTALRPGIYQGITGLSGM